VFIWKSIRNAVVTFVCCVKPLPLRLTVLFLDFLSGQTSTQCVTGCAVPWHVRFRLANSVCLCLSLEVFFRCVLWLHSSVQLQYLCFTQSITRYTLQQKCLKKWTGCRNTTVQLLTICCADPELSELHNAQHYRRTDRQTTSWCHDHEPIILRAVLSDRLKMMANCGIEFANDADDWWWLYTVGHKKTCHFYCGPISIILSLLDS